MILQPGCPPNPTGPLQAGPLSRYRSSHCNEKKKHTQSARAERPAGLAQPPTDVAAAEPWALKRQTHEKLLLAAGAPASDDWQVPSLARPPK